MNIEYQGGNIYNKYESRNPLVEILMKKYFNDLDSMINQIEGEVRLAIEIGCGEGYLTQHINDLGIKIEGADIHQKIVDIAIKLHPSIPFQIKSIYDLSSYDKHYDLVLVSEVIEHLDDPELAIREVIKVSNKYILLTVPNDLIFRLANISRLKYLRNLGNTPGHINHWSEKSFQKFLKNQGLSIIQLRCSTLWLMALCRIPGRND